MKRMGVYWCIVRGDSVLYIYGWKLAAGVIEWCFLLHLFNLQQYEDLFKLLDTETLAAFFKSRELFNQITFDLFKPLANSYTIATLLFTVFIHTVVFTAKGLLCHYNYFNTFKGKVYNWRTCKPCCWKQTEKSKTVVIDCCWADVLKLKSWYFLWFIQIRHC